MLLNLMAKSGGEATATLPKSANIIMNLRADSLAQADASAVTSWTDTSSNALVFANASSTATFRTNQLNGKPSVRFGGAVNAFLTSPRASGGGVAVDTAITTGNYTIMVVARLQGTQSLGCIFGATAGGNSIFITADVPSVTTNASVGRYTGSSVRLAPAVDGSKMFVTGYTSQKPYTAGSGTGLERRYLNGTIFSADVVFGPVTAADFSIGGFAGGTQRSNVDVFDIVIWNTTLTPTESIQVTKFYCDKYAQAYPWASATSFDVYDGNSLTMGVGSSGVTTTYPYVSALARSKPYGTWTNVAVGGITVANMQAKLSEWTGIGAALGLPMKVASFEYYNSRGLGVAGVNSANASYIAAVKATSNIKLAFGTSLANSSDPSTTRNDTDQYLVANGISLGADAVVQLQNLASIGAGGGTIGTAGSATSGSNIVNYTAGTFVPVVGQVVTFSDGTVTFPAGTTITAVGTNQITVSNNALATTSGLTVTGVSAYTTNVATNWSDTVHLNGTGYQLLAPPFTSALNAI